MGEIKDLYIGMDLGGTFLKYAIGDEHGNILYKSKTPSRGTEEISVIFKVIFSAIEELLEVARNRNGRIKAVGFGTPGVVDFENAKLLGGTPNLHYWGDADIRKEIEGKFNIPTWADNDANVMALAEAKVGAARGHRFVICLTLGTGIGGGILLDGQVYRGSHYAGAELGHVVVEFNGLPCNCGGYGCLEQYAAAPAMVRRYESKLKKDGIEIPQNVTTELIFEQAKTGDKLADETIDETCEYLGAGMATMANALNPEIFVLGGGLADAGNEFIKKVEIALHKRVMDTAAMGLKVVRATLGNDAGIVGAMILAAEMNHMNK